VILFDSAGVGRSSGDVPQTIAAMAEHAMAFLDALGITTCDVIGYSLGGMVALQMVQTRSSIVRRMILVGRRTMFGRGSSSARLSRASVDICRRRWRP
jgi:pimeloyl-ACP methyl ester carboxylesterase